MKGILLDDNFDLKITNGSLEVGNTDYQNIDLILIADKGDFKGNPLKGVDLESFLKSVGRVQDLRREIIVQLEAEGHRNPKVEVLPNGDFTVDIK